MKPFRIGWPSFSSLVTALVYGYIQYALGVCMSQFSILFIAVYGAAVYSSVPFTDYFMFVWYTLSMYFIDKVYA